MLAKSIETIELFMRCLRLLFDFKNFTHTWRPLRREAMIRHVIEAGISSIPIIALSTAFSGLVITHELAWHMDQALGSMQMIPGFTGQFIVRELGVAVPLLLLTSKVGAAIAAEIATMKATEQLDALRMAKVDLVAALVLPRIAACTLAGISLACLSITVTMVCSLVISVTRYHFGILEYLNILAHFVKPVDLMSALIKSAVFGAVIPVLCCAEGFRADPTAEGVGKATTRAVVNSTLAVIVLDFILSAVLL